MAAYLRSVTLREPDVLRRLREETAPLPLGRMQISPEQGQFMRLLVEHTGAQRTLELGVFTGYSALSVALALPDGGRVIACDISEEWTTIARRYWKEAGVAHKIDLHLRPGLETLSELIARGQAGSFDMAFIDADKENYQVYYERALQLLRPRGLILVDNVLWHGRVIDAASDDEETEAIRRFNAKLLGDERISLSMLPVGDGLTLALKR
ncbi:MAG: class I SAM-dependent methyltransferase [Acidobacteria bacterium]|nr:class I SAM-dependent methyltransferase [Acidobacteriota bacterium]